jgi:catechol 2,3-dioxygenase-like lactoylglutathione lyase family enzyme
MAGERRLASGSGGGLAAIGQVARTVSDVARAERWYADVLGLTHLYTYGRLAFFDCAGVRLMLTEKEEAGAESLLYFRVEAIEPALAALAARGADIRSGPHRIFSHPDGTEEWMAFFDDPDGRPLALMEQRRPTVAGAG